jgi:hypothetical protein
MCKWGKEEKFNSPESTKRCSTVFINFIIRNNPWVKRRQKQEARDTTKSMEQLPRRKTNTYLHMLKICNMHVEETLLLLLVVVVVFVSYLCFCAGNSAH